MGKLIEAFHWLNRAINEAFEDAFRDITRESVLQQRKLVDAPKKLRSPDI